MATLTRALVKGYNGNLAYPMETIRILILEDDLETLSKLLEKLHRLEESLSNSPNPRDIAVTIFSEYTQVESYLNTTSTTTTFDVILLDRDCKLGGSFHALDINKSGVDKIISISSIPEYNEEARKMGITRIVHKDYTKLDSFADGVIEAIRNLIG